MLNFCGRRKVEAESKCERTKQASIAHIQQTCAVVRTHIAEVHRQTSASIRRYACVCGRACELVCARLQHVVHVVDANHVGLGQVVRAHHRLD
eukprot:210648-Pleurochrysis_carterae.AAC.1